MIQKEEQKGIFQKSHTEIDVRNPVLQYKVRYKKQLSIITNKIVW